MIDYTKEKEFWERLKSFVENVQVNDLMSEEEKQMILNNCEKKIENLQFIKGESLCEHEWVNNHDGTRFCKKGCDGFKDHLL